MNWKTLTIDQYQRAWAALREQDTDPIDQAVRIVSALTNKPESKVEELGRTQWRTVITQVRDFAKAEIPIIQPPKVILCGGRRYRINPRIDEHTVGQLLVDLKNFTKTNDETIANLHVIVAVFVVFPWWRRAWSNITGRPIDRMKAAKHLQKHCPVYIAYSIAVFFCEVWMKSVHNILSSSSSQNDSAIIPSGPSQAGTSSSGDGFPRSTEWPPGTWN